MKCICYYVFRHFECPNFYWDVSRSLPIIVVLLKESRTIAVDYLKSYAKVKETKTLS